VCSEEMGSRAPRYACGATFALSAESATARRNGDDWLDVVSDLISANRDDDVITRSEWLDHFESLVGARPRAIVETLLDRGRPESSALIDELFEMTGVATIRLTKLRSGVSATHPLRMSVSVSPPTSVSAVCAVYAGDL